MLILLIIIYVKETQPETNSSTVNTPKPLNYESNANAAWFKIKVGAMMIGLVGLAILGEKAPGLLKWIYPNVSFVTPIKREDPPKKEPEVNIPNILMDQD